MDDGWLELVARVAWWCLVTFAQVFSGVLFHRWLGTFDVFEAAETDSSWQSVARESARLALTVTFVLALVGGAVTGFGLLAS